MNLGVAIEESIFNNAVITIPSGAKAFAFEVDGFGSHIFMDDANVPSLLSFPYLGFVNNTHPIYVSTRKALLSSQNSYYFSGKAGSGIGGPHCGFGYFWPMSIIMRALTSDVNIYVIKRIKTKY